MPSGVGPSALNEGKGLGSEVSLTGEADLRCTAFDPKLANCQTESGLGMLGGLHGLRSQELRCLRNLSLKIYLEALVEFSNADWDR